ncbi:hypothetical protein A2U01_0106747, partial [Trifolium medium]|nr:hypothetical protein [Trifolium medium]
RDLARLSEAGLAWRDTMSPGNIISNNLGSTLNFGPQQVQINPNSS